MINYYRDNADILFHFKNMDMTRIITLKEDDFTEKNQYPYAPKDIKDALDNYDRVLEIVGEIAGNFVAPRARMVDKTGVTLVDGEVVYPKGTLEAMDRFKKADLSGFLISRKYGGINMPLVTFSAAIEMMARADASTTLVFILQGLPETIQKFGSEEQKQRLLPRFASGEIHGSMALTEPDAGSDLQSVMLKATPAENGKWLLNGVKRFITNGCQHLSLVLARSEEGTKDARGLSFFIYERDENMKIRRIEHKLGIQASPTCELQFNNAEAELLGKRKMGLIKYAMFLMNSARLAVAAQSVGIAEAAYREADSYSKERSQFKSPIRVFPAVYEMLIDMKTSIEAARTLLYETARLVDMKEGIENHIEQHPEDRATFKSDLDRYSKYVALFTPLVKNYAAEMSNKVCYDAIQIHGGSGYTKEFNVERYYRDARITSIYEGTTQLQNVAAISSVMLGVAFERLNDYENDNNFESVEDLFKLSQKLRAHLEVAVSHIKEKDDKECQKICTNRVVDMVIDTIISYLLCIDATKSDRKRKVAHVFISKAKFRVKSNLDSILSDDNSVKEFCDDILS
ncbi:acyl-CoA dehydrogenase family protein [Candidatus Poribacteria bacterium]|nr:acyl-CoA dehydrogenase family protein [Candidatus Poribacteria bacterium]